MNKFLALAVVLATCCVFRADAASYCYTCTNCADPFDYTVNTTCATGSDTCMKTYISYPTSISGSATKLIYRGCVPSSGCPASFGLTVANYGFAIGCCSGNLCNSAQAKQITIATSVLPILAAAYYLTK